MIGEPEGLSLSLSSRNSRVYFSPFSRGSGRLSFNPSLPLTLHPFSGSAFRLFSLPDRRLRHGHNVPHRFGESGEFGIVGRLLHGFMIAQSFTILWGLLMPESVECFVFLCRNCGVPIMLPCDAYTKLNPSQWVQPTDEIPVALVCDICKHVYIYSPHQNSRYHRPTDMSGMYFHNGVTVPFLSLQCEGGSSEFRLPLVVTWRDGIREGEKQQIAEMWIGGHLECPNQHRIHWPWRQSDPSK